MVKIIKKGANFLFYNHKQPSQTYRRYSKNTKTRDVAIITSRSVVRGATDSSKLLIVVGVKYFYFFYIWFSDNHFEPTGLPNPSHLYLREAKVA